MAILKILFEKRKIALSVLLLLLLFQLIFSFIYPSSPRPGENPVWLSLQDLISNEKSALGSADIAIVNKFTPVLERYTLDADGGVYILLAENFPWYYFENPIYLGFPLYSFLVSLVAFFPRLIFDSLAAVFASAIFLNFILALSSVLLLYLLVEKLISARVAFLSSVLYIFSPIIHRVLPQPTADIFGAFIVIASLYLLLNYLQKPYLRKLTIFSLIIGIFMLGKMFAAISIFILILAFYFKRYREGALFFAIHLIPLVFWYFYVTLVLGLNYYDHNIQSFGAVIWLLGVFSQPWYQTAKVFLDAAPNFILAVIYGFLLLPVIFAAAGFKRLLMEKKEIFAGFLIISFLALFFVCGCYFPRHGFYLYPLIYPLAVLGIDRTADFLKRYKNWLASAFYLIVFAFLIIVSSADIHKIFS